MWNLQYVKARPTLQYSVTLTSIKCYFSVLSSFRLRCFAAHAALIQNDDCSLGFLTGSSSIKI